MSSFLPRQFLSNREICSLFSSCRKLVYKINQSSIYRRRELKYRTKSVIELSAESRERFDLFCCWFSKKYIDANIVPAGTYQVIKLTTKSNHVKDLTAKWIEMATKLNHKPDLRLLSSDDVASNVKYVPGLNKKTANKRVSVFFENAAVGSNTSSETYFDSLVRVIGPVRKAMHRKCQEHSSSLNVDLQSQLNSVPIE